VERLRLFLAHFQPAADLTPPRKNSLGCPHRTFLWVGLLDKILVDCELDSTRLILILSRIELASFGSLISQFNMSSSQLVSSNELAFINKTSLHMYWMN
jgi:hypothetical protein